VVSIIDQFNNLAILPNAEMGDPEYQKKYGMQIVETKIINIHGSLAESRDEISEMQDLVIATATMPRPDWVRARAFSWMTALLHFDKMFQLPLILVHETCSISYRDLIENFLGERVEKYPILAQIKAFFIEKALDIQNGGTEYCHSSEWLDIFWPMDEFIVIKLCVEGKLHGFYHEAEQMVMELLESKSVEFDQSILHEAIELNLNLIKTPFQNQTSKSKQTITFGSFTVVLVGVCAATKEI
jgi:hypothetical protein